jgi:hypothetical protein
MRKTLESGIIGAVFGAALLYLAAGYGSRPNECPMMWHGQTADGVCTDKLPDFFATLLPDPAKLTADWQPFEAAVLLRPQQHATPTPPQAAGKQPGYAVLSECPFSEDIMPDAVYRAVEQIELLPIMPGLDETAAAELDLSQSEAKAGPITGTEVIKERLNRLASSYLKDSKWPVRAEVDTMEFRPSDAKQGEFASRPFSQGSV